MTTRPTALPTALPRRRIDIHLLKIARLVTRQVEADQEAARRKAGFVPAQELGFEVAGVAGGAEVSVLFGAAEVLADDDGGDEAQPVDEDAGGGEGGEAGADGDGPVFAGELSGLGDFRGEGAPCLGGDVVGIEDVGVGEAGGDFAVAGGDLEATGEGWGGWIVASRLVVVVGECCGCGVVLLIPLPRGVREGICWEASWCL